MPEFKGTDWMFICSTVSRTLPFVSARMKAKIVKIILCFVKFYSLNTNQNRLSIKIKKISNRNINTKKIYWPKRGNKLYFIEKKQILLNAPII